MHARKLPPAFLLLVLATAAAGCGGSSSSRVTPAGRADFAVLSDVHLHDVATLGGTGYPKFDAYLAGDRKMLAQSEEILDAALADLAGRSLDFVLISGDLTKDGEEANHQLLVQKLTAFEAATGTRVYVVPGNHDVDNASAYDYVKDAAAPSITSSRFRALYERFGYGEALAQDPASLSYVAEPVPGVWLLAVDSAEWDDATGTQATAGRIRAATHAWILARLAEAAARGKTAITMMHHGVVEHFSGQAALFPEYLLEGYQAEGQALAEAGVKLVFTGHFHANDVVTRDYGTATLTDVETGSLVTAPSPYRLVHLDVPSQTYAVSTLHVTGIPSHPDDFVSWSEGYLMDGLVDLTTQELTQVAGQYGVTLTDAQLATLVPLAAGGMAAHYAGDERPSATVAATISAMTGSGDATTAMMGQLLAGLWTDLAPADDDVVLQPE